MGRTKEKINDRILEEIEREFPGDPALQQIHMARYIISREVKEKGINLQKYIENYFPPE